MQQQQQLVVLQPFVWSSLADATPSSLASVKSR